MLRITIRLQTLLNFVPTDTVANRNDERMDSENEPKKKKYAKEAWPGRKSLLSGL